MAQRDFSIFVSPRPDVMMNQLGVFDFKYVPEAGHALLYEEPLKNDLVEGLMGSFVHLPEVGHDSP